jgi:internalin A
MKKLGFLLLACVASWCASINAQDRLSVRVVYNEASKAFSEGVKLKLEHALIANGAALTVSDEKALDAILSEIEISGSGIRKELIKLGSAENPTHTVSVYVTSDTGVAPYTIYAQKQSITSMTIERSALVSLDASSDYGASFDALARHILGLEPRTEAKPSQALFQKPDTGESLRLTSFAIAASPSIGDYTFIDPFGVSRTLVGTLHVGGEICTEYSIEGLPHRYSIEDVLYLEPGANCVVLTNQVRYRIGESLADAYVLSGQRKYWLKSMRVLAFSKKLSNPKGFIEHYEATEAPPPPFLVSDELATYTYDEKNDVIQKTMTRLPWNGGQTIAIQSMTFSGTVSIQDIDFMLPNAYYMQLKDGMAAHYVDASAFSAIPGWDRRDMAVIIATRGNLKRAIDSYKGICHSGFPEDPYFFDDIVESAIKKALSGKSRIDIAYLASLDLKSSEISDLSPLRGMVSLTKLDLSFNTICDLSPLKGLTSLTELSLDLSQISDLSPLRGLTSLSKLYLWTNNVSDLSPLRGLTNLMELYLWTNDISDLSPLRGLTSLTKLYLSSNQISDLSPLTGLTKLTNVSLSSNQISDLSPLRGLTNLTILDLDYNQIINLSPLKDLTNLTSLDLSNNRIIDLSPLRDLAKLTTLDLSYNQISDLGPLRGLKSLTSLSLDNNHISDLNPLKGLTSLKALDLSFNRGIKDLSPLLGMISLTNVNLSWNQVMNLSPLKNLTNLTCIDLSFNQISDLSPLKDLTNLNELDLNFNQISDLSPIKGLTGLTSLSLGVNKVCDLSPLTGLTNLTSLSLYSNQISDLSPLRSLTNLTGLGLSSNQISDLSPLKGLSSLTSFDLDNNQISDLSAFLYWDKPLGLYLENNPLASLYPLTTIKELTVLKLSLPETYSLNDFTSWVFTGTLKINWIEIKAEEKALYRVVGGKVERKP